jgi:NAD+--asparagine ADP-ribosyltransferase
MVKEGFPIGDYYVLANKKSQFVFVAQSEVRAFSLSKRFLHATFSKYPDIATEIKEQSFFRYKKNVRAKLLKYRDEHIEELNKKSTYKVIILKEKDEQENDE